MSTALEEVSIKFYSFSTSKRVRQHFGARLRVVKARTLNRAVRRVQPTAATVPD